VSTSPREEVGNAGASPKKRERVGFSLSGSKNWGLGESRACDLREINFCLKNIIYKRDLE
tara:strand:- start:672 stop:851 length:180 start_codon:yes stop_codon:yes gene_type:complete